MGKAFRYRSVATGVGLAGLALLLGATPASAEQARTSLSVTATVVPACAIRQHSGAGHAVACSTGARVTTMTARRHDEQPLHEASAILGSPVRRGGDVVFTAPLRLPAGDAAEAKLGDTQQQRYLTLTY